MAGTGKSPVRPQVVLGIAIPTLVALLGYIWYITQDDNKKRKAKQSKSVETQDSEASQMSYSQQQGHDDGLTNSSEKCLKAPSMSVNSEMYLANEGSLHVKFSDSLTIKDDLSNSSLQCEGALEHSDGSHSEKLIQDWNRHVGRSEVLPQLADNNLIPPPSTAAVVCSAEAVSTSSDIVTDKEPFTSQHEDACSSSVNTSSTEASLSVSSNVISSQSQDIDNSSSSKDEDVTDSSLAAEPQTTVSHTFLNRNNSHSILTDDATVLTKDDDTERYTDSPNGDDGDVVEWGSDEVENNNEAVDIKALAQDLINNGKSTNDVEVKYRRARVTDEKKRKNKKGHKRDARRPSPKKGTTKNKKDETSPASTPTKSYARPLSYAAAAKVNLNEEETGNVIVLQDGDGAQTASSVSPGENGSVNSDVHSVDSNDSGKGNSDIMQPQGETYQQQLLEYSVYELELPRDLVGRLIGRQGRTVKQIGDRTGARLTIKNHPFMDKYQICAIEGNSEEIKLALEKIRRIFPINRYPEMTLKQVNSPLEQAVLLPDNLQLTLPEEIAVDSILSSLVSACHVFLQQPCHPTYPALHGLSESMFLCYSEGESVIPQLPRPIEVGVICAAPVMDGWFRAQVVQYYPDSDEVDVKFCDYGGYTRMQAHFLRQIRCDFMTIPFQASECYLANVTPIDETEGFTVEAAAVLEELTQGRVIQVQIVGHAEDGVPYVHIYAPVDRQTVFINREMVNRGVVKWTENFEW